MHVAIVGAGAIGTALAGDLVAVTDVTLVGHAAPHLERLRSSTLTIVEPDGSKTERTLSVRTDHTAVGAADLIVLAVKSYDTAGAMADLEPHLGDTEMLTLQNGLGNVETIREVVDPASIIGGTTTAGVTLEEPGTVRVASRGHTRIGRPWGDSDATVTAVADTLADAGYETEVVGDVRRAIWEKVLSNVGINPVTALCRVRNGALLSGPGRELLEATIDEAQWVARAEGYDIEGAAERALAVAEATGENQSSMLRDLESGRRTEIDALNGAIVERGAAHGIDTPVNRTLTAAVRAVSTDRSD